MNQQHEQPTYSFDTIRDRIESARRLLANPEEASTVLKLYAGPDASHDDQKRCVSELVYCAGYISEEAIQTMHRLYPDFS